jgi:hypothetical protein
VTSLPVENESESPAQHRSLAVSVFDAEKRLIARELLEESHWSLFKEETWLHGLRRGLLGEDLAAVALRVLPGEPAADGSGEHAAEHVTGFVIELEDARGTHRRPFPLSALASVIRRFVARLRAEGVIDKGEECSFSLTRAPAADRAAPATRAQSGADAGPPRASRVVRRHLLPAFEPARLSDYLARARRFDGAFGHLLREAEGAADTGTPAAPEDEPLPIFVPRHVWEDSRAFARRGGERESGAVWTGRLLRDEESPEVFVVIDASLPAESAEEAEYSLTFSGETWSRLQARLAERRKRLGRPHERFCASVHGHNFGPSTDKDGNAMCSACATAKVCGRSTAHASTEDETWHRGVFAGQPWAALLVHGWTARKEEDWRLYGLADGGLRERPVHILEESP